MPVILARDDYDLWLDPGITNVKVVAELLKPFWSGGQRQVSFTYKLTS